MESLTKKAQIIIKQDFNDKNIVKNIEKLHHDGYDKYGPESNLWDLYIITEENNKYIMYFYHWEDWYDSDVSDLTYQFYSKEEIYDISKIEIYLKNKMY